MENQIQTDFEAKYRETARSYIVQVMEAYNWSQAELARKVNVAPSTFTRAIQEKSKCQITPKTLFKVADVSKIPLPKELLGQVGDENQTKVDGDNSPRAAVTPSELFTIHRDVPLYSLLPSALSNGLYDVLPRGYTERPNILVGITEARALIVPDDSMAPVFAINHIVATNPAKLPRPGDDVVVQLDCGRATIRRLVEMDENKVTLAHFHPRYCLSHFERARVVTVEPIAFIIRP